jgi:hypothetical protein
MTLLKGHCLCGLVQYEINGKYPVLLFFHTATLESPELFKPQKVFWASSRHPWDHINPKLEVSQNA